MQLSQLIYDFPIRYSLTGEDRSDDTVTHITNDSRQVKRDSVFVCIRGAISDGHYYAGSAYGKGCRIFVASRPLDLPSDAMVILTENTRAALVTLSIRLYRQQSATALNGQSCSPLSGKQRPLRETHLYSSKNSG